MASREDIANHTLELLKRMSAKLDSIGLDVIDVKARIAAVEDLSSTTSHRLAGVEVQMTNIIKRMDRFEGRMDRIERRLDLRSGTDD